MSNDNSINEKFNVLVQQCKESDGGSMKDFYRCLEQACQDDFIFRSKCFQLLADLQRKSQPKSVSETEAFCKYCKRKLSEEPSIIEEECHISCKEEIESFQGQNYGLVSKMFYESVPYPSPELSEVLVSIDFHALENDNVITKNYIEMMIDAYTNTNITPDLFLQLYLYLQQKHIILYELVTYHTFDMGINRVESYYMEYLEYHNDMEQRYLLDMEIYQSFGDLRTALRNYYVLDLKRQITTANYGNEEPTPAQKKKYLDMDEKYLYIWNELKIAEIAEADRENILREIGDDTKALYDKMIYYGFDEDDVLNFVQNTMDTWGQHPYYAGLRLNSYQRSAIRYAIESFSDPMIDMNKIIDKANEILKSSPQLIPKRKRRFKKNLKGLPLEEQERINERSKKQEEMNEKLRRGEIQINDEQRKFLIQFYISYLKGLLRDKIYDEIYFELSNRPITYFRNHGLYSEEEILAMPEIRIAFYRYALKRQAELNLIDFIKLIYPSSTFIMVKSIQTLDGHTYQILIREREH